MQTSTECFDAMFIAAQSYSGSSYATEYALCDDEFVAMQNEMTSGAYALVA